MAKTIREMKDEGLTVLLSEQNLRFATLVADRAYVIEKGRIRYRGTMRELAANNEIRKTYLTL
jgi:branched-chain amino acid transport system ATP-binding protein